MMNKLIITITIFSATTAFAQEDTTATRSDTTAVIPSTTIAIADTAATGSWIAVKGTIKAVGAHSFILGHEGGTIPVAFNSQALRDQGFAKDQQVTVYGRVDEDLLQRTVLKARTVVVQGADAATFTVVGEEDAARVIAPSSVGGMVVHGVVSAIHGRNLHLDRAEGGLIVDTSKLNYDPTKAEGHRKVEVGDMVTAAGIVDWRGRTMKAASLDIVKYGAAGSTGTGADAGTENGLEEK
jgi:uncharacterized protein YdeI (BOF family)